MDVRLVLCRRPRSWERERMMQVICTLGVFRHHRGTFSTVPSSRKMARSQRICYVSLPKWSPGNKSNGLVLKVSVVACPCVHKSRVSGTFEKQNSCLSVHACWALIWAHSLHTSGSAAANLIWPEAVCYFSSLILCYGFTAFWMIMAAQQTLCAGRKNKQKACFSKSLQVLGVYKGHE